MTTTSGNNNDLELCQRLTKATLQRRLSWVNISNSSEDKWEARHLDWKFTVSQQSRGSSQIDWLLFVEYFGAQQYRQMIAGQRPGDPIADAVGNLASICIERFDEGSFMR